MHLQLQDVSGDSEKARSQETKIEEIEKEDQQVLPEEDIGKVAEN